MRTVAQYVLELLPGAPRSAWLGYCHVITRAGAAAGGRLVSELICVYLCITSSLPNPSTCWNEAGCGDACHLILMHGIGGIRVKVDTRLLIQLLKQEGDVGGNTVNKEVMDVEEIWKKKKKKNKFIVTLRGNIVRMKCSC